jgi:hypothetical protein
MGVRSDPIEIDGLRKTLKDLQTLGTDKSDIIDANYGAAVTLIREAKPLVPVRSGLLASTLKPAKTAGYAAARAGLRSADYANPIHWGWSFDAKTGTRKNIKPSPFFIRALGYTRAEIIANYDKQMQKLVDRLDLGATK